MEPLHPEVQDLSSLPASQVGEDENLFLTSLTVGLPLCPEEEHRLLQAAPEPLRSIILDGIHCGPPSSV